MPLKGTLLGNFTECSSRNALSRGLDPAVDPAVELTKDPAVNRVAIICLIELN